MPGLTIVGFDPSTHTVTLVDGRRLVANVPSGAATTAGAPVTLAWPVELGRCVGD